MHKTKEITTVLLTVMSLSLLISGCSKTSTTDAGSQSLSSSVELESGQTGGDRTIQTSFGDVKVPETPKRVIATYGMGDLLALGVKPVATYQTSGTAYEKEVADLSVWNQFEAEEIMAFDPDLILVVNQEQYDEVSKIAPTILIPFTQLSMDERVTYLGEILNKQEEAKKALTDFKEKIAKAKETLNQKGITSQNFSIFEASSNGGIWVYGDKWGRGGDLIYSQLGLNAPDIIQKEIIAKDQYRELSMESVQDYAGDYIIFSGELGSLLDNPVWNSIPAVKAGNVIPINEELFYDIDLYSSGVQLDYLIKALIDK
jgi:iron complex transport system substrate-binding protein